MKKFQLKETTGGILRDENGKKIMKTLKGWKRWGKQFVNGAFNVIHVTLWEADEFQSEDWVRVNISTSERFK
jgi:hypothetical protein